MRIAVVRDGVHNRDGISKNIPQHQALARQQFFFSSFKDSKEDDGDNNSNNENAGNDNGNDNDNDNNNNKNKKLDILDGDYNVAIFEPPPFLITTSSEYT